MLYDITPMAKPRMTRGDKYNKRSIVQRYWAYKAEIRLKKVKMNKSGDHVIFYVPIPESWSKKKKLKMDGKPHQQTPDIDNLLKGLMDSIFDDDKNIWDIRATKYWANQGAIEIHPIVLGVVIS